VISIIEISIVFSVLSFAAWMYCLKVVAEANTRCAVRKQHDLRRTVESREASIQQLSAALLELNRRVEVLSQIEEMDKTIISRQRKELREQLNQAPS